MPSSALYFSVTERALIVMPRSFSIGLSSSTCSVISRAVSAPVISRIRSESVVFPWSMWATIEKLRMREGSVMACDGDARPAGRARALYLSVSSGQRERATRAETFAGAPREQPPKPRERDHDRIVSRERARGDAGRRRRASRPHAGMRSLHERVRRDAARHREDGEAPGLVKTRQAVEKLRDDRLLHVGHQIAERLAGRPPRGATGRRGIRARGRGPARGGALARRSSGPRS